MLYPSTLLSVLPAGVHRFRILSYSDFIVYCILFSSGMNICRSVLQPRTQLCIIRRLCSRASLEQCTCRNIWSRKKNECLAVAPQVKFQSQRIQMMNARSSEKVTVAVRPEADGQLRDVGNLLAGALLCSSPYRALAYGEAHRQSVRRGDQALAHSR